MPRTCWNLCAALLVLAGCARPAADVPAADHSSTATIPTASVSTPETRPPAEAAVVNRPPALSPSLELADKRPVVETSDVAEAETSRPGNSRPVVELAAAPQTSVTAAQVAAAAVTAPPEPFSFAPDAAGKLHAERLPPPKTVPLKNFEWVTQPQSASTRFPDVVPQQLWMFPVAAPGGESKSLPVEHPVIARVLPTLDRPPLPAFSVDLVPQPPEFTISLRTQIAATKSEDVPTLAATPLPFEIKPQVQDDPSAPSAWKALLVALPFGDPLAAPPERLTIPDPFDYLRHVQVKSPPIDALAPSVSYERPAPLVLPVETPK